MEIGKIVGLHGLKGDVKAEYWCDGAEVFCALRTLYLNNGETKLSVNSRPHKNIILIKIDGINTAEQAESLKGHILFAFRDDIPKDPGSHFIQDLIGLQVQDFNSGKIYGNINDVLKTGANDVYSVADNAGKEYLVPVIDSVVKEINLEEGKVIIKPIEGIFL